MKRYDFAVVGAGSAGRTAVETLAETAPGRSVLLVDAENALPYKRTQVSKNVVSGFESDAFAVHDASWYAERGVDLITGIPVSDIDAERKLLRFDEATVGFGRLLLATGARPLVPFPVPADHRWSVLWTLADARKLKEALRPGARIAVVGNGVLGVESAWQASLAGAEISLVGKADRPMARYLDSVTAGVLQNAIGAAGIRTETGCVVERIDVRGNGLELTTSRGSLEADHAVLTAGSAPAVDLAAKAGLALDRGILVDRALRTSAADIWAAGDCARHPDGRVTGLWHSAEHQGRLAALSMLGEAVDNSNPPYRLKCEVFGGFWFSAGPVTAPEAPGHPDPPEDWNAGDILWRPRFHSGVLAALSGVAPSGMDKSTAKSAQNLLLQGVDRPTAHRALVGDTEPLR